MDQKCHQRLERGLSTQAFKGTCIQIAQLKPKSGTATRLCHPSVGEVQSHVQANTLVITACNEVYRYILATQKTLVEGSKV